MKILIIGGTGLISTAITRQLLEQNADVTLYNRGQSEARFAPGARTITGDRNDMPAFERQMAEAGPFDCVLDMICFTPQQAESTIRAFRGRAGQVIFCSTVDVYTKPAHRYPLTEDEPLRGNNTYGRNKVLCENLFSAAHQQGDFAVTIIRPAMTYGEGRGIVDTFGWTTRVFDRIRRGRPLIVHGDGSAIWVACHVDDAARAFINAMGNSQTYGRAYHVTGEEWLTWNRYYELAAEAVGVTAPPFVHIPTDLLAQIAPRRAEVTVTNFQGNNMFDNSAARRDLGFAYMIPWLEGARRTYQWLDAAGKIESSDDDPVYDRILAAWEKMAAGMREQLAGIED